MSLRRLFGRKKKLVSQGHAQSLGSGAISTSPQHVSPTPEATTDSLHVEPAGASPVIPVAALQTTQDLDSLRDETWKMAYEKLRVEQKDVIEAYEQLVKEQNDISHAAQLGPEEMGKVVSMQRDRMERKQWRYTMFGKEHLIRDTVATIFGIVQQASDLISVGMAAAPPYVSLPWSMVTVLIPFVVEDVTAVQSAIDGLKDVASIMAKHSYAEREFLTREQTRADFQEIIAPLYMSIFEYQAAVALYFAKSTMARLGINLVPNRSWKDALAATTKLAHECQRPLADLSTRLTQVGFDNVERSLHQGQLLLQRIEEAVISARTHREKIQQWLSPINSWERHSTIRYQLGRRYYASGKWLLEDPAIYLPWKSSSEDVIFLQGIVGSGKSALTSIVVEDLLRDDHGRVLFAYCTSSGTATSESHNSDTLSILRSLLSQLAIRPDGSISPRVRAASEQENSRSSSNLTSDPSSVVMFMRSILEETPDDQISLVIDALDECANYDDLLRHLSDLQAAHRQMRIFLSARDGVAVASHFPKFRRIPIALRNADDIRDYVEKEVSCRFKDVGLNNDQATRLKEVLIRLADGMFRWVELAIDYYLPAPKAQKRRIAQADIERRLSKLENSQSTLIERLMETYQDIWEIALGDEDEESTRMAVTSTMKWVLCSFRPLTTVELLDALAADSGDRFDEAILLERCSNFVVKDLTGHIRLAHLSVRQFFEDQLTAEYNPSAQHSQAAWSSLLTVISFRLSSHEQEASLRVSESEGRHSDVVCKSFVDYCRASWAQHYHLSERSTRLEELLDANRRTLDEPFRNLISWIAQCSSKKPQPTDSSIRGFNGPLEFPHLREDVLEETKETTRYADDSNVLSSGSLGRPFQWISAHSDTGIWSEDRGSNPLLFAQGLEMERGAVKFENSGELDVRDSDADGNSVLHYATFFDRPFKLRELVQKGGEMESVNLRGKTPLQIAAAECSAESFLELVKCGATWSSSDLDIIPNNALRQFLESELITPRPTLQLASTKPQVFVSMAGRKCQNCDLRTWLEASRRGEVSNVTSTRRQQREVIDAADCELCHTVAETEATLPLQNDGERLHVTVKVIFDAESNLPPGRDTLRLQVAGGEYLECELYVTPFATKSIPKLARDLFRGRQVKNQQPSETVANWIEACKSHPECSGQLSHAIVPTRMIDLQSDVPRLCEGQDADPKTLQYVYLSHRWGGTGVQALTADRLKEYRNGFAMSTLPRLWKEVMAVAREIGYRYLWIDALCVVQDDMDELFKEVNAMPDYIAGADMVFATANTDPYDHLTSQRSRPDLCEPFLADMQDGSGTFQIHVRYPLQTALDVMTQEVFSRCWRQQEALLPKRLVIFGRQQLYWSCAHGLASEGDALMVPAPWTSLPNLREKRQHMSKFLSSESMRNDAYQYWYYLVETNSQGALTYSVDRFNSFIGLGRETLQILDGEEIQAGLLSGNIPHGLLWIHMPDNKTQRQKGYDDASYAGPSWSWLSASKEVSYSLIPGLQKAGNNELERAPAAHFVVDDISVVSGKSVIRNAVISQHHLQPGGFMQISSLALSASDENKAHFEDFLCFYDVGCGMHTGRMEDPYFVIVAQWMISPSRSKRWVGLIISWVREDCYVREGVFIGPDCDDALSAWSRAQFTLY